MEEKKLTDEEIVKALEEMASECPANFSASVLALINRQNAEIERLTERNYWLESEHEYQCEKSYFEGVKKGQEQAVKDTAKEIYTDLLKEFSIRKSCGNADVVVIEMASRKGVEVE